MIRYKFEGDVTYTDWEDGYKLKTVRAKITLEDNDENGLSASWEPIEKEKDA